MINRISKIVSITLVLIIAFILTVGCKAVESEEEATVEASKEASVETAEEEVTEEDEEEEKEAEEPETVTITNSSGREVTINKSVESIVFTHPSTGEALRIVNVWNKVVGMNGFPDPILYPNSDELPVIAEPTSPYDLNYEKVFELHPDIFLTTYIKSMAEKFDDMVATLEPEIPVVALNLWEPETIVENFRKLGLILGQEEEAEEFIEFYKGVEADISAVTSKIPDEDKPRVFFNRGEVVDTAAAALVTFSDDFPGSLYRNELTGCINIAADLSGSLQTVDPEWIIEQDPDVIVSRTISFTGIFGLDIDDTSAAKALRDEIMKLDVFSGGSAVKNGNIYLIISRFAMTQRYVVGLAYQAKWFHPDLFADLDPQAIHQEYLTRFMRIDYDLSEHGVFVYPEP